MADTYYDKRFRRLEAKRKKRKENKKIDLISKEEALASKPDDKEFELWKKAVDSVYFHTDKAELSDIFKMYKLKLKSKLDIATIYRTKKVRENLNDVI